MRSIVTVGREKKKNLNERLCEATPRKQLYLVYFPTVWYASHLNELSRICIKPMQLTHNFFLVRPKLRFLQSKALLNIILLLLSNLPLIAYNAVCFIIIKNEIIPHSDFVLLYHFERILILNVLPLFINNKKNWCKFKIKANVRMFDI